MRKIVMTGFVAAAAVLGSVVPAVTASAVTSGTAAVRLPAASAAVGALAAPAALARPGATITVALSTIGDRISCASPTACLAVGTDSGSSGNEIPIAQALHGTAWKSVAVKTPKGATSAALTGVSCKAAMYCLVVGEYASNQSSIHPAAWTWNGTALTPVAAPSMPGGTELSALNAVSCVAVKSCVAIGTAFGSSSTVQLIWTWNGKAWKLKAA